MRILLVLLIFWIAGCAEKEQAEPNFPAGEPSADSEPSADGEPSADREPVDVGEAFLFINAKKPDVQVMESGLQFEILESGEGRTPVETSSVVTHYHGTFVDGTVFDSSVERGEPIEFPVTGVIPGWTQALLMMKEGDKWRLVLPPDLAYGKRGAGGGLIPPDSVLVFEVELIEVKD